MNSLTVDIHKKVYANGTCAIENLAFSAQPGEFVTIVGPSGAGQVQDAGPDLLLVDEPFQSLDAPTADQLRGLLQDLWQRTCPTVLFVTLSLREALNLADRILFLSARPFGIIFDYAVDLPRPRAIEDLVVQKLHESLLEHPPNC